MLVRFESQYFGVHTDASKGIWCSQDWRY